MVTTTNKTWTLPTVGGSSGTWGDTLNDNTLAEIDSNLGGVVSKTLTNAAVTLSTAESRNLIVRLTGTLSGNVLITTECVGFHVVENLCTLGAYDVTMKSDVAATTVTVPYGRSIIVFDDTNGARIVGTSQIADLASAGVIKRSSAGTLSVDSGTTNLLFARDGGGIALSTGVHGDITVPFACTITGVIVLADQSGSMVLDLWKDSYANYPPTVADTITASAKPTLSSATKYTDTTLTGWTKSVSAGDVIRINANSVSAITRYTLALTVTRY